MEHDNMKNHLIKFPEQVTSHLVLVIDQSASMLSHDVTDHYDRS